MSFPNLFLFPWTVNLGRWECSGFPTQVDPRAWRCAAECTFASVKKPERTNSNVVFQLFFLIATRKYFKSNMCLCSNPVMTVFHLVNAFTSWTLLLLLAIWWSLISPILRAIFLCPDAGNTDSQTGERVLCMLSCVLKQHAAKYASHRLCRHTVSLHKRKDGEKPTG